jgi:hypothetical protein
MPPKNRTGKELPIKCSQATGGQLPKTTIQPQAVAEPVTLEEINLHSARTKTEAIYNPTEAESKDLLESEHMKAVDNLQSYQSETRAWRDKEH